MLASSLNLFGHISKSLTCAPLLDILQSYLEVICGSQLIHGTPTQVTWSDHVLLELHRRVVNVVWGHYVCLIAFMWLWFIRITKWLHPRCFKINIIIKYNSSESTRLTCIIWYAYFLVLMFIAWCTPLKHAHKCTHIQLISTNMLFNISFQIIININILWNVSQNLNPTNHGCKNKIRSNNTSDQSKLNTNTGPYWE